MLAEKTPGEVISEATDVKDLSPSASESVILEEEPTDQDLAKESTERFVESSKGLGKTREGQTLIGPVIVAQAIVYAGLLIARAIRDSQFTTS